MTYSSIILVAAKAAKTYGVLMLAICNFESNLTNAMVLRDGDSPTFGVCQIKFQTAQMLGFKGKALDLMNPKTNAKWAAKYLKYQETRYGDDWCKLAASYNAGSYNESKKKPGYPRNLKYVRGVQRKLPEEYRYKMSCDTKLVMQDEY